MVIVPDIFVFYESRLVKIWLESNKIVASECSSGYVTT